MPRQSTQTNQTDGQQDLVESIVQIKRTSKKTKGGDRLSFTALSVVGNKKGKLGIALAKAPVVVEAIHKAHRKAKRKMFTFPLVGKSRSIPHRIEMSRGACRVLLKPAPAGTGVRASAAIRSVLEAGGIENIITKILGSSNIKGNVDTVVLALQSLKHQDQKVVKDK